MKKHALWIAAVAVTAFAFSLDAVAQQTGGQRPQGQGQGFAQFGGGAAGPTQLLRNEEVVKILGITAEQTEALRPQGGRGQGQAGQGGTPPTAEEMRARTAETWSNIDKVLKEDQLKKFKDIYFQANVPTPSANAPANAPAQVMALNVYLLGALDLTADQKEKIGKIADDRNAAARAVTQPGQGASQEERAAARAANAERNTKANDAIVALLTDAQKKKMDELKAGAADLKTKLGIGQGQGAGRGAGGQGTGGQGGGGRGNRGTGN